MNRLSTYELIARLKKEIELLQALEMGLTAANARDTLRALRLRRARIIQLEKALQERRLELERLVKR